MLLMEERVMRKIYFDKARKLSHTAAILMIMIAVVMVIAGVTVYVVL